ncbi:hypothetical protein FYJ60_11425 [Lachnospiraceae bacterium Oil+RF-744-WCA-WT-13]|uniref:Nitrogenase/oxidoreductase component 1 domain-containing protein n=2 Tax=Bilifractor porci TaxID=2606636 RepID=A0A7X2PAQ3_9FIRM|nr:hypothetical protein [Bilifractor porci]
MEENAAAERIHLRERGDVMITEEITLFYDDQNCVVLPGKIFAAEDIVLAAAGSLTCIRALYKNAVRANALERFAYCVVSDTEYAAGTAEKKIVQMLNKVLRERKPGGIILYTSCTEIITKMDYDRIKEALSNPGKIPVEVLYRGPMVKRFRNVRKDLNDILLRIAYSGRTVRAVRKVLPPVTPDFEGIASALQVWDTYNFLLSAGGCDGCFSAPAGLKKPYQLTKTRFNNLEAAVGCEDRLSVLLEKDLQERADGRLCCLLSSAVPHLLGVDSVHLASQMSEKGLPTVYLESDGFHSGNEGISRMYLTFVRKFAGETEADAPGSGKQHCGVGILGSHLLASAAEGKISHGIEHLHRDGYDVFLPEEHPLGEIGKLAGTRFNWVVSAEGLEAAYWIKEKFQIPVLAALPVGKRSMLQWRNRVAGMMKKRNPEELKKEGVWLEVPEVSADNDSRSALLIGDPVLTHGIALYLKEMRGFHRVTRAVYAPVQTMENWYRRVLKMADGDTLAESGIQEEKLSDVVYFRSGSHADKLFREHDLIIGDRIFKTSAEEEEVERKWLDLPDPLLSHGIITEHKDYTIFGKKGAAWLDTFLDCSS